MAQIDDFKANLIGGGARANQFRVTITPPPGIAIGLDVRRTSFLVTTASLPDVAMNFIAVPFRGRNIQYIGDRSDPADFTVTVYNDTDFMIRNAMERWQNGINDFANNTGVIAPADFQTDLQIEQLDRDETILKTYILRNYFPVSLGAIELSSAQADAIETFDIVWKYTHFETSSVNF